MSKLARDTLVVFCYLSTLKHPHNEEKSV